MMHLRITPYADSDRQQVLSLWNSTLPLDAMTEDAFESRILLDENFDPETFLIARDGTRPVGFALGTAARRVALGDADPQGVRAWIIGFGVDHSSDLVDVGVPLLKELESRFRTLQKKECFLSTYPPGYLTPGIDRTAYRPLLDFFLQQGFKEEKQALSMDASIVLFEVSEKILQSEQRLRDHGIEIRPYRRSDLLRFLDFLEKSMPTDWVRVERRNLRGIATGQFKTDQVTVVTHGEEIIGYCQFEGSHFGPFGVAEPYQGRGIGTVLLARTLERMRHMGYHDAWVMWTDDVAAVVYRKFGFQETRRFSILKKDISRS